MNKRYLFNFFAILVSLGLMVFTGCEEVDDSEVSAEDSTSAIAKADSATLLMETMMDNVFNSEPDSVQDMIDLLDFSEPYALYSEAATLDPGNGDANFGMAFTGFLMLSQDQDLQDMLLTGRIISQSTNPSWFLMVQCWVSMAMVSHYRLMVSEYQFSLI